MSVKCEQPLDELAVLSLVTVSSPKLKILHFVSETELRTDKQTDGRSDFQMPPMDLSGREHKNNQSPHSRTY